MGEFPSQTMKRMSEIFRMEQIDVGEGMWLNASEAVPQNYEPVSWIDLK